MRPAARSPSVSRRPAIRAHASALGRDQAQTEVDFVTHGIDAKADWLAAASHLLSFGVNAWRIAAWIGLDLPVKVGTHRAYPGALLLTRGTLRGRTR